MSISLEEARARLEAISETLSLTLNQALERYEPDEYIRGQFEEYLPAWGDRTLHDFVQEVVTVGGEDGPDILHGDMKPFHILRILDDLYRV